MNYAPNLAQVLKGMEKEITEMGALIVSLIEKQDKMETEIASLRKMLATRRDEF